MLNIRTNMIKKDCAMPYFPVQAMTNNKITAAFFYMYFFQVDN